MDRSKVDQIARDILSMERSHREREIGWPYRHGQRTARLSLWLRRQLFPDREDWDDILYAAASLHDCAKKAKVDHGTAGAARAVKLLRGVAQPEEIAAVHDAILRHNKRGTAQNDVERLLQDADIIDHFGSIEVWLCASYSVLSGSGPEMAMSFYREEFDKMVGELLPQFNFEVAKNIFLERVQYSREFSARLAVEGEGGVFREELYQM